MTVEGDLIGRARRGQPDCDRHLRFQAPHRSSPESLAGFAQSTSILSRSALDGHLEAFARDLYGRLLAARPDGHLDDVVSFTYDLAIMP